MRHLLWLSLILLAGVAIRPVYPAAALASPDPAAARSALILTVSHGGLQQISGAALAAGGLDLAQREPRNLWLRHRGQPVALEVDDGGDGRFDPSDTLRFYAPAPGDRWNQTASYWLTVETQPGPRIAQRAVAPQSAPLRTSAFERGAIDLPVRYDSRRAGPDGDRWFAADLRPTSAFPASQPFTLTANLPPAPGTTSLTVTGQLAAGGPVNLELTLGGATGNMLWTGNSPQLHNLQLADSAAQITVTASVLSGAAAALIDRIIWERPAQLDFAGRGAHFWGVAGVWRYTLTNLPPQATLYDVSDPAQPVRLDPQISPGAPFSFEDGPTPRAYLLAGTGTLHEPVVSVWAGADLATPQAATAVYIVPAALHSALEPLVAHRVAQGHAVRVVEVESIYASWSHGHVDPEAIRSFLRYAAATWPTGLRAVILVGDGSVDPHDWTRRGPLNVNLIPPYLAPVDPWLGETACDSCYVRVHETDPTRQTLPDLALGRLPVKNADELRALVAKLIAYDAVPTDAAWRNTLTLVAEEPDTAGDFAEAAEAAVAYQPASVQIERIYYDPSGVRGPTSAVTAHNQLRAAFANGSAALVYHGHSHAWQWARTDHDPDRGSLLDLYEPDQLANQDRPAVVLAMTCLSSAFQTPALSGTTVDERLVLAPGGAVAVWGPTGFGVAHGHQHLQRGFFEALWQTYDGSAEVGALTLAGYTAVIAGEGPRDVVFSYALLGDPLTRLRMTSVHAAEIYLPVVVR